MSGGSIKAPHLLTGMRGENMAAEFLRGRGMAVLERNWRPPPELAHDQGRLELDIIARHQDTLVFVEVKTRCAPRNSPFKPLDAFTVAKQDRLLRAAALYLESRQSWGIPCRFDLICIVISPDNTTAVEHHENVLTFESAGRDALGGGHAAWQPW